MADRDLELLQGTLDVIVLKSLDLEPRHGYGVARWIRRVTDGALEVEEGALYTALHRMHRRGWLESEWGLSENNRRAKFYRLTDDGRKELTKRTERWSAYATAVFKVLDAGEAGA